MKELHDIICKSIFVGLIIWAIVFSTAYISSNQPTLTKLAEAEGYLLLNSSEWKIECVETKYLDIKFKESEVREGWKHIESIKKYDNMPTLQCPKGYEKYEISSYCHPDYSQTCMVAEYVYGCKVCTYALRRHE